MQHAVPPLPATGAQHRETVVGCQAKIYRFGVVSRHRHIQRRCVLHDPTDPAIIRQPLIGIQHPLHHLYESAEKRMIG